MKKLWLVLIITVCIIAPIRSQDEIREQMPAVVDSTSTLSKTQSTAPAATVIGQSLTEQDENIKPTAQTPASNEKNNEDSLESGYSQTTRKRYSNYVGFAGGFVTGYGISYRRWFDSRWGLQLNLFPMYREHHYPEDDDIDINMNSRDSGFTKEGDLSIGLTYLKLLADLRYTRVLFYAGGNLQTEYDNWDWWGDDFSYFYVHRTGKTINNKVSVGCGVGVEWFVWRFAFHCMLGLYGAYQIEDDGYEAQPSIEGGVHFRL